MLYLLIILSIIGFIYFGRSNELFCISSRSGVTILVRGKISGTLFNDFQEVLNSPIVKNAVIRAFIYSDGTVLRIRGIYNEGQEQRIRNVFGIYPVSNLRLVKDDRAKDISQLLGFIWLAWLIRNIKNRII